MAVYTFARSTWERGGSPASRAPDRDARARAHAKTPPAPRTPPGTHAPPRPCQLTVARVLPIDLPPTCLPAAASSPEDTPVAVRLGGLGSSALVATVVTTLPARGRLFTVPPDG